MKILLTTHPGLGHFHPLLPLAQALQRAGHQVTVACAHLFIPWVEARGLRAVPAGLDWLLSQPEKQFPEMKTMSAGEQAAFFTDIFLDTAANHMACDLLELCKEWRPDVIVREQTEYGGCVAAECLDLPHAALGFEFFLPDYLTRLRFESQLAYLRSTYGLPPYPAMEMLTRYLYLSTVPPGYQFQEYPLPPVAHSIRPVFARYSNGQETPDWVSQLPDQPTVYVSLGTVFSRLPQIFKMILEGLGNEPYNVVITMGGQDLAQFGPAPSNIHIEKYIPQDSTLMPRWDVIITHGGASTTLAALSCGLPVLVIPLGDPQLLHATRCTALGVGQALLPPWYGEGDFSDVLTLPSEASATQAVFASSHFHRISAQAIHEAVRTLLNEPGYRQAAQQMQADIEALPGPEHAVALLERLAVERQPLL